ncbi:MAG: HAD-IA family hydrolase [Microgenomates group bacterium]
MSKKYDTLLFDMDGVLVDVNKSYRAAIRKTARYFMDREVSVDEVNSVKQRVGMNNDWDATYALIGNKNIPYEKVKDYFQKIYLGDGKNKGLINEETLLISKGQLTKLRKKYKKMGIVTGRPKDEAQYVINRFDLGKLFDVLITKDDTLREKPFADPIIKAIQMIKCKRPVYIGDSSSDVVASGLAGIPCLYIGNNMDATKQFKSMLEIYSYLI